MYSADWLADRPVDEADWYGEHLAVRRPQGTCFGLYLGRLMDPDHVDPESRLIARCELPES